MTIKQQLLEKGTRPRPGRKLDTVSSITIHWIGPYPAQETHDPIAWWQHGPDGKGLDASAHFVIKDDDCVQVIPTDEVAWHCGGKGNYTSIGIEVIPENKAGKFSDRSIATLKELLKQLPHVELLRHFDWTQKDCPLYYTPIANDGDGAARWEALKDELKIVSE